MEILPGAGVVAAKVGEPRAAVERRLGAPHDSGNPDVGVYGDGRVSVLYTADDHVELVMAWHDAGSGDEVTFDGVQLTWRFVEDVTADLAAKGYRHEHAEGQGVRFEAGFFLVSSGARAARDLDPGAGDDDPRPVCDSVSIAPYEYLTRDPAAEETAVGDREIGEIPGLPEGGPPAGPGTEPDGSAPGAPGSS